jgi:spore coat polysaccharide biosynthesis protein SpsF
MVSSLGKVGAIIQARVGSNRLPGKVLLKLPFGGVHSIVENVLLRARKVPSVDTVVLATSRESENDSLAAFVNGTGASLFRGSENNVLERFHQAAAEHALKTIVRLTADNPCIDPVRIEQALHAHAEQDADYSRTVGLPLGMNVEIFSFEALTRVLEAAERDDDKEHVTLYMNRHPASFKIAKLDWARADYQDLRMTVDWEGDYAFACFLYDRLYETDHCFGLDAVTELLDRYPWAKMINRTLKQEQQVL